jgi:hypothetical protein
MWLAGPEKEMTLAMLQSTPGSQKQEFIVRCALASWRDKFS